jgi:hypothetical protein
MNNGEKVTSEHAKNLLEKRFTGQEEKRVSPNRKMTVLLVDELDMLWNRLDKFFSTDDGQWPLYLLHIVR